ncbi:MAG: hypothetical protein Q4C13_06435, partial [Clostridia bacterium]|nr:hypothetical protein [Clostridia bacterium]
MEEKQAAYTERTAPEAKPQLRPEDMPEFQDVLSQGLIRDWRKQFPHWSDERIIETLMAW